MRLGFRLGSSNSDFASSKFSRVFFLVANPHSTITGVRALRAERLVMTGRRLLVLSFLEQEAEHWVAERSSVDWVPPFGGELELSANSSSPKA